MNTSSGLTEDLSNDPFAITVFGVHRFPEARWRGAILNFLDEMRSSSAAARENPSIAFGSIILKLDRTSNRYYAYGTKPETPHEKSVRSAKQTSGSPLTIGNDRKEVEYALGVLAEGGAITRLHIHFDTAKHGGVANALNLSLPPALFLWGLENVDEYVINVHNLPVDDPMLERSVS